MRKISLYSNFVNEKVDSYEFNLESDSPFMYKYTFSDIEGNKYLVEFKNIPVIKVGELSTVYELLYYVEDEGSYSVSKIVNVNPYRVLETVFGSILNDFTKRCRWVKNIFFVGLAKDLEKDYVTSRTKIYKRYLEMNPPVGFNVSQGGNAIRITRKDN